MAAHPRPRTRRTHSPRRTRSGGARRGDPAAGDVGGRSVQVKHGAAPILCFDGVVWRYLPAWGHPLDAGFLLLAAGRWNRYGEYGCLYTALTRRGAVAEYEKVVGGFSGVAATEDAKRDVVSLRVRVEPVLDLTDRVVRRWCGAALATLVGDDDASLEACRSIADAARKAGYRAILSPSAALRGGANLNIYLEGRAANLRLHVGPDREPLNY